MWRNKPTATTINENHKTGPTWNTVNNEFKSQLTPDEEVRAVALKLTITRFADKAVTNTHFFDQARKFEKFIRGEEVEET